MEIGPKRIQEGKATSEEDMRKWSELTEAEQNRLKRAQRTRENRRGRKRPAQLPNKLARTAAFAPRRNGLITDSKFERTYVVAGGSVIHVSGRELGSQHRDAIYALFRLCPKCVSVANPNYDAAQPESALNAKTRIHYETRTTWRELIRTLGNTAHPNNLLTLLQIFEELQKVVIRVQRGNPFEVLGANDAGNLNGPGMSENIITRIVWHGAELDSVVEIYYGEWIRNTFEANHLVSLNADVQFRLKNDHAKSFWPYIDSQVHHHFVDEDTLAGLAGRNLWSEGEDSATRSDFRKKCKRAFDDMKKAGGLQDYEIETLGKGRRKSRRYHYIHALPRQMEMDISYGDNPLV